MNSRNGSTKSEGVLRDAVDQAVRAQRAMKRAVRKAALAHKAAGAPMVVCEGGRIREIAADEFLRPPKNGRKKRPSRR